MNGKEKGDRQIILVPESYWKKIPAVYRQHATFSTDGYASYQGASPPTQHQVVTKASRKTNPIERFNGTLDQRLCVNGYVPPL